MCKTWFYWGALFWIIAVAYTGADLINIEHNHHSFRVAPLYLLCILGILYGIVVLMGGGSSRSDETPLTKSRATLSGCLYGLGISGLLILYENNIVETWVLWLLSAIFTVVLMILWSVLAHRKKVEEQGFFWYVLSNIVVVSGFITVSAAESMDQVDRNIALMLDIVFVFIFALTHGMYAWHIMSALTWRMTRWVNLATIFLTGTALFVLRILYTIELIDNIVWRFALIIISSVALAVLSIVKCASESDVRERSYKSVGNNDLVV